MARLQLGAQLRALRSEAGLDGPAAAEAIGASASKISRIEGGLSPIRDRDLVELLDLYRVYGQHRTEMLALARESRSAGWWADYPDLQGPRRTALAREAEAVTLRTFDPFTVPAILQTPDYARALSAVSDPDQTQGRGGIGLPILARRRALLTRASPPQVWAVITDSVLRRAPLGDQGILRAQLAALRTAAAKPNITIQIVPDDDPAVMGAPGAFTLVRFAGPDVKDVVVIEELTSFDVAADTLRIERYRHVWYQLAIQAFLPAASMDILQDPEDWFRERALGALHDQAPGGEPGARRDVNG